MLGQLQDCAMVEPIELDVDPPPAPTDDSQDWSYQRNERRRVDRYVKFNLKKQFTGHQCKDGCEHVSEWEQRIFSSL